MVRPRGFEPPAYRSVVRSNTESQVTAGKRGSVSVALGCLSSLPYPSVLAQSGHNVVTNNVAVGGFAYRFTVLRSLKSNKETATCQGLRPACDHSIKGLCVPLSNTSMVWMKTYSQVFGWTQHPRQEAQDTMGGIEVPSPPGGRHGLMGVGEKI